MSDHAAHSHSHELENFAHPAPIWQLLLVFFALVGLTIVTVFQSTLELGNMELILALIIATIKAVLVMLFFMHMLHDKPLNVIIFISAFVFVALFIGFTMMDAHAYRDSVELKNVDSPRPVAAAHE